VWFPYAVEAAIMAFMAMFRLLPRRAAIAGLMVVAVPAADALAQPVSDLWSRWARHDDASRAVVDHAAWDTFLMRYAVVGPDGVVRLPYGRVATGDRQALDAYLTRLQNTPVSSLSRTEQLAYWINFYNALTVKLVLGRYPVKSIRDIGLGGSLTSAFFGGPWDAKIARIEGEQLSLNDVEHRILRPIWRDPRVHYALNCASIGCPPLRRVAFTAANASGLMDQAAREYVNGSHGMRHRDDRVWVSSIYRWFREDFGGTDASVLLHLKLYAAGEPAAALARASKIVGDFYDWNLNDQL
jgi:hypothetical protein